MTGLRTPSDHEDLIRHGARPCQHSSAIQFASNQKNATQSQNIEVFSRDNDHARAMVNNVLDGIGKTVKNGKATARHISMNQTTGLVGHPTKVKFIARFWDWPTLPTVTRQYILALVVLLIHAALALTHIAHVIPRRVFCNIWDSYHGWLDQWTNTGRGNEVGVSAGHHLPVFSSSFFVSLSSPTRCLFLLCILTLVALSPR